MEGVPHNSDGDPAHHLTALRHRHRNQIQVMTSLVGLFGRRMPQGERRDAFTDLRARFEALSFPATDEAPADAEIEVDLPELAGRLVALLDAGRRHEVTVMGGPVRLRARRAETASQILAEMVIALYRRGLPAEGAGAGRILIERGGKLSIEVGAEGGQRGDDEAGELGRMLLESHARSCGATLVRTSEGPLRIEVAIPIDGAER